MQAELLGQLALEEQAELMARREGRRRKRRRGINIFIGR